MKSSWTAAVLTTGALLTFGCGDRAAENLEEATPQAEVPAEPGTAPPSTLQDGSTGAAQASPQAPAARTPTSAQRPAIAPPPAAAPPPAPAASSAATTGPASSPAVPAAPSTPQFREVTVPAGTALPLTLVTALSSETAQVETPVRARMSQAVVVDGYTALPAGAVLSGHVIDVERAGRVQGRSRLAFRFTEVDVNGTREDLRTNPITFEGEATKGEDATKIGAGAVGGAIIGGIIGGGSGAAKGAAIGGAAGTGVVLATRGEEVTLAAGTDLAASLATAFTVRAPAR